MQKTAYELGFEAGYKQAKVSGGKLIATTGARKGQALSKAKKSPKEIVKQEYAIMKSKQRRGDASKKDVERETSQAAREAYGK